MSSQREFKKEVIGQFVLDAELSLQCIVPAAVVDSGPSSSRQASKKEALKHEFDWKKKADGDRSTIGRYIYVQQTEAVLRRVLPIKKDAKFSPGPIFQKNSSKDASVLSFEIFHRVYKFQFFTGCKMARLRRLWLQKISHSLVPC